MDKEENAVEFKNVSFSYDDKNIVLDDISVSIKKGSYVCILGHNGSGKSTFSKIAIGLLKPSIGSVIINGITISRESIPEIRKLIGMVFQNPDNQFIAPSVRDDIAFGLENHNVKREEMENIILKAARAVNIENILESAPEMLSGGLKQRVAVAGQIALDFDIIIFDEATSMLDPKGRIDVLNIMKLLNKEHNKTIVAITHFMDEVINADYIYLLDHGKKILEGTPIEIFENAPILKQTRLDFPFIFNLSTILTEKGVNLKPTFEKDDLIKQLWKQATIKKKQ